MHLVAPVGFASELFLEVLTRGMIGLGLLPHFQPGLYRSTIALRQMQFDLHTGKRRKFANVPAFTRHERIEYRLCFLVPLFSRAPAYLIDLTEEMIGETLSNLLNHSARFIQTILLRSTWAECRITYSP